MIYNNKYFSLVGIFVLLSVTLSAQSFSGKVLSENREPLIGANVIIINEKDEYVTLEVTNEQGGYHFSSIENYTNKKIVSSYLGYKSDTISILDYRDYSNINFELKEDSYLDEVVLIEKRNPFTVKGDSTIVDATQYFNDHQIVFSDLVKRIPGAKVSEDGKVSFRGKSVENLYIEGGDLFGKDYGHVVNSLKPSAIQSIEFLDNFSENELLKSFNDSDKMVMNLKIKSNLWGVITGGLTTELGYKEKYDLNTNVLMVKKKIKNYLYANSENINGIGNKTSFVYDFEDEIPLFPIEGLTEFSFSPNLFSMKKKMYSIGKFTGLSNDVHIDLGTKSRLKVNVKTGRAENTIRYSQKNKFITFQSSSEEMLTSTKGGSIDKSLQTNLDLKLKLTEKSNVNFIVAGTVLPSDINKYTLINGIESTADFNEKDYVINNKVVYINKLSDHSRLILKGGFLKQKNRQKIYFKEIVAGQKNEVNSLSYLFNANYKYMYRSFDFSLIYNISNIYNDFQFYDIDNLIESKSERESFNNNIQNIGTRINYKIGRFIVNFSPQVVYFRLQKKQDLIRFNYYLSSTFEINKNTFCRLGIGRNTDAVDLKNFITHRYFDSSTSIRYNRENLNRFQDRNSYNFSFGHKNRNFWNISILSSYSILENPINSVFQSYQSPFFVYENSTYKRRVFSINTLDFEKYIENISSSIGFQVGYNYSKLRYEKVDLSFSNWHIGMILKPNQTKKIDLEFNLSLNLSKNNSLLYSGLFNTKAQYSLSQKSRILFDFYSVGDLKNINSILNLSWRYKYSKRILFFVEGNNLFNVSSIQKNISMLSYESRYEYGILPRTIMLGMNYSF